MSQSQQGIEEVLRRRIRDGFYATGSRLPSRRNLQDELKTSSATLQRAFDRLVEQGYVGLHGAQGTYVANLLPHQSTYAMILSDDPEQMSWNRFLSTAKRVAETWPDGQSRFRIYSMSGRRTDSAAHRQLCKDLADGGLAGIVFINTPHFLDGSPIFAYPIPRVCIGGGDVEDIARYNMSLMTISDGDVPSQIVRHFHAAGRSRFAALTALTVTTKFQSTYKPLLRSLGMETRQEWWLGLPIEPTMALTARTVTHLLLSGSERQRPDCLLITDDNLLPHATAGAIDAGLELPHELTIVAHANYPGPTKSAIPCLRYGPDMEANVRAAVAEISHLAAGGKPRNIDVPNVFGET